MKPGLFWKIPKGFLTPVLCAVFLTLAIPEIRAVDPNPALATAAISAGTGHTLILKTDGTVWASGDNTYGQLGTGSAGRPINSAVQVMSGVKAVSAGDRHSLFLKTDGTAWAAGSNFYGQLGAGELVDSSPTPVQVMSNVVAISAGTLHSLFLKSDSTVWAVGDNSAGQFGNAFATTYSWDPVQVRSGSKAIFASYGFSLFLDTTNVAYAAGYNGNGQLGDGTTIRKPTAVAVLTGVQAIAAGDSHSLFLKTDGTVWGTGSNQLGQLASSTYSYKLAPVSIQSGVRAISAGGSTSLFLKNDGSVYGTGDDSWGQIGDGVTGGHYGAVASLTSVQAIAVGESHCVFMKTDGTVVAAGSNSTGQLGDSFTHQFPTPISLFTGVSQMTAGDDHNLFIKTDGTVWASGRNVWGGLGDGTQVTRGTLAQVKTAPATNLTGVKAMAAGSYHSLFLKTDGTVWGTGSGYYGEFGVSDNNDLSYATSVASSVQGIAAGGSHSFFIPTGTDGTVLASGDFDYGELGTNAVNDYTQVTGQYPATSVMTGVKAVSTAVTYTLFLKSDGTVWEVGQDPLSNSPVTTPFQVFSDTTAISAGGDHALFLKTDGTVWAMGANDSGQLGSGSNPQEATPVQVNLGSSGVKVKAISAGYFHSLFLKTDGTVWATGSNYYGQLGTGDTNDVSTPVQVQTDVTAIAAGAYHSLFLKTAGAVMACGDSLEGEVGVLGFRTTPNTMLSALVSTGTDPNAAWLTAKFGANSTNAAIAGWGVDADHDGINNRLERAFNLNPLSIDAKPMTSTTGTSGMPLAQLTSTAPSLTLKLQYIRLKTSANTGFTYVAQVSSNLSTWTPMAGTETVESIDSEYERVTISDTAGTGAGPRFVRVAVTGP